MNEIVLDASAILAIVFQEPGAEKLTDEILDHAVASTVNLAEVQSKLVKKGYIPEEAWEDALSLVTGGRTLHKRTGEDRRQLDCKDGEAMGFPWEIALALRWRLRSRLRSIPPKRFGKT